MLDSPNLSESFGRLLVANYDLPLQNVPLDLFFKVLGQQGMHCNLILEGQVASKHSKNYDTKAPCITFEGIPRSKKLGCATVCSYDGVAEWDALTMFHGFSSIGVAMLSDLSIFILANLSCVNDTYRRFSRFCTNFFNMESCVSQLHHCGVGKLRFWLLLKDLWCHKG